MTRALALLLALASCGARTGLDEPFEAPPAGEDGGAPRCETLAVGEILRPFGDARTEGPIAVVRDGGFDLVALVIEGSLEYQVVRLAVRDGVLVPGAGAVLGPEARSVAAAAARGSRLGLCYGGVDLEGPTRFVHTDAAYGPITERTVGTEGGDHCVMLVPIGGHWLVGWQDRGPSLFDWAIAEMDDEGRLLGARDGLVTPPLAGARLASAAVWAQMNDVDRTRLVVTVHTDGGTRTSFGVVTEGASVDRAALGPSDGDGIAVAWIDARGGFGSLRLEADGTSRDRAFEPSSGTGFLEGPRVVRLGGRDLSLLGACRDVDGPGRLELRERAAGRHEVAFALDRPICPVRPAIASLGDRAVLAWQEEARVHAALLSCAP